MSDLTPSGWVPRVLNEESQQADRNIFKTLHQVTAEAVLPLFLAKFQNFAASGLADDFTDQAALIGKLLLEVGPGEPFAAALDSELNKTELRSSLAQFLGARAMERGITTSDRALATQLSIEFSGSFWATVISSLVRQNHKDCLVSPRDLLPDDLHGGQTNALSAVHDDLAHFDVAPEELNQVMAASLSSLLRKDEYSGKFLSFPRNLRTNRAELSKHVNETTSRHRNERDIIQMEVVHLERNYRRRSPFY